MSADSNNYITTTYKTAITADKTYSCAVSMMTQYEDRTNLAKNEFEVKQFG